MPTISRTLSRMISDDDKNTHDCNGLFHSSLRDFLNGDEFFFLNSAASTENTFVESPTVALNDSCAITAATSVDSTGSCSEHTHATPSHDYHITAADDEDAHEKIQGSNENKRHRGRGTDHLGPASDSHQQQSREEKDEFSPLGLCATAEQRRNTHVTRQAARLLPFAMSKLPTDSFRNNLLTAQTTPCFRPNSVRRDVAPTMPTVMPPESSYVSEDYTPFTATVHTERTENNQTAFASLLLQVPSQQNVVKTERGLSSFQPNSHDNISIDLSANTMNSLALHRARLHKRCHELEQHPHREALVRDLLDEALHISLLGQVSVVCPRVEKDEPAACPVRLDSMDLTTGPISSLSSLSVLSPGQLSDGLIDGITQAAPEPRPLARKESEMWWQRQPLKDCQLTKERREARTIAPKATTLGPDPKASTESGLYFNSPRAHCEVKHSSGQVAQQAKVSETNKETIRKVLGALYEKRQPKVRLTPKENIPLSEKSRKWHESAIGLTITTCALSTKSDRKKHKSPLFPPKGPDNVIMDTYSSPAPQGATTGKSRRSKDAKCANDEGSSPSSPRVERHMNNRRHRSRSPVKKKGETKVSFAEGLDPVGQDPVGQDGIILLSPHTIGESGNLFESSILRALFRNEAASSTLTSSPPSSGRREGIVDRRRRRHHSPTTKTGGKTKSPERLGAPSMRENVGMTTTGRRTSTITMSPVLARQRSIPQLEMEDFLNSITVVNVASRAATTLCQDPVEIIEEERLHQAKGKKSGHGPIHHSQAKGSLDHDLAPKQPIRRQSQDDALPFVSHRQVSCRSLMKQHFH